MLDSLITSKTRVKLLLKFFLNSGTRAYLRELAKEFGESTNAVRTELNRLSKAGLLKSENDGNTKLYHANTQNPLYIELHNLVKKYLGIDFVEEIINNLGNVELAFITGDYAKGKDIGIIDVVIVGDINQNYLNELVMVAEENLKRKIRALVLNHKEYKRLKENLRLDKSLLIWSRNGGMNG
jgi:hypothetical protein